MWREDKFMYNDVLFCFGYLKCSIYGLGEEWMVESFVSYFYFYVLFSFNIETPGDQIVRKLTFERIEELKKSIRNDQLTYK